MKNSYEESKSFNDSIAKAFESGNEFVKGIGNSAYTVPTPQNGGSSGNNRAYNNVTLARLKSGSFDIVDKSDGTKMIRVIY